MIALHPFSARAQAGQAHLRIMETTDLHVHVLPYDYYADRPVDTVGLSRTAALVRAIRAEATNALLVDNGDFLQGNPMGDYIAYERGMREGDLHPVIAAMNTVGFDAATLGNHEFNYGLDFLMKSLAGARFPFVSANVVTREGADPTRDETLLRPYVILDRRVIDGAGRPHRLRVGMIGFVPPQTVTWDRRHLEGRVRARDILAAARAWVPRMKEEGADIIVALSHSGIGPATHAEGMENASVPLARVEGIDALMTGHQHLVFPGDAFAGVAGVDCAAGTIHGKPAVMGGAWGSHLGVIDLLLETSGGEWRIVGHEAAARPIARRDGDGRVRALVGDVPEVVASVREVHAATLAYVRRPVGRTSAPLHSYFALVAGDPSVRIVNRAQAWYVAEMLKGTAHAALPLLSAAAPFKAGGRGGPEHYTDVPAGDIAIGNVADLYLYPNTVRAVRVTGAELADWLERSAGIFRRIVPGGRDQILIDPDFPSYNFDVIDGVTYRIDLSRPPKFGPGGELLDPAARRIVDLSYQGRPVDPAEEFVIATNSYRAGGGGDFPGAKGDTIILEAPDTNRDVLVRYIVAQGTIDPAADGNWSFAPLPGTTVLFDTGPGALRYLADLRGLAIEPAGEAPGGFARFRIAL
ncbi:MAG: bifunctional 2',3'-cyclic-nucleotide 2'-phosphodiesterase/3'-nucleotidase [Rhodobacteraceae bacterium]|nr:bifunctional 2',3'-cyclic-nucleotide 2'-phosphodiesterase/3'-nucleotidase [Paracoccaceae bacterium]